jgi:DnaJ homolog subfamily B member 11
MEQCSPRAYPHFCLASTLEQISGSLQECEECPEVRLEEETVTLQVEVEPGMEHGQVITLSEEGEPHPDSDPGDLNLVLAQVPHKMFVRERTNLKVSIQISLVDALAGFRHEINHLDGHKVSFVPSSFCVWHSTALFEREVGLSSQ